MAFASQPGAGFGGGQGAKVQLGPELQEIQTQEVGFLSIAGDSKIRLLPTPWPRDSLPPPTCSLLSVASTKGLLAAAGPEGLVIASTDGVRKAYTADATGDSNIRPFQPQLQIPLPQKVSHVAFSADDNVLVVAAADGSGLIAFQVAALLQNNLQPALTLALNGARLRSLAPRPKWPELFAAVTTDGELLIANLNDNQLDQGPSGPVFKTGVSCVSWSNKGKQLVAGLGDGTAYQMEPTGEKVAEIPRPPDLDGDKHVSSISWLEDHAFCVVYTPTSSPEPQPESSYYIINRQPPDNYTFQKLPEVCPPWGLERNPAYQFIGRLRDFKPDLREVLIVASTASTDIGLFTKSSKSISEEGGTPAAPDTFSVTTMSEDSRRAELPLTDDAGNTSPIGLAIDLSSKDVIVSPIPGEDIKDSGTPLPAILVLNDDGVLSSWWFVYSESIRQGIPYRGLVAAGDAQPSQPSQPQPTPLAASMATPQTPKPAFGQSSFGKPSFGQPSFGQLSFGKPSTTPFGTPSALGSNRQPAFGTPSALGSSLGFGASQPSAGSSFGSTTPMGGSTIPAFGIPSVLGQKPAAFGQPSPLGKGVSSPAFGQSGFAAFGAKTSSPSTTTSGFPTQPSSGTGGGFSSFATGGGFASAKPSQQSPFAKASAGDSPFANRGQPVFGSSANKPPSADATQQSPFGGFSLTSSFKKDETSTMDEDKPEEPKEEGAFSFGGLMNFDKPNETEPAEPAKISSPPFLPPISSIPQPEPAVPEPQKAPEAGPPKSLFGPFTPPEPSPAAQKKETPSIFGKPSMPTASKEPEKPSLPTPSIPSESSLSESTVKVEPPSDKEETPMPNVPEPPLPPEPTSRVAYAPGDTSASSSSISKGSYEEAPLPPDFIPAKKAETPKEVAVALPEESEGEADFEDSGEDIGNETSPIEETAKHGVQSLKTSPESSFGGPAAQTPDSTVFKAPSPVQPSREPKQLFGEITQPMFPAPRLPDGRVRLAPRSPSPVRRSHVGNALARDGLRSTSAPSAPGHALAQRKVTLESSMLANQIRPPSDEEDQKEEINRQAQRLASEAQELSEDDEDEQLRADLARPLSPAPTLDPFLPHQDYTGESLKPGIPGQIERLYRDINSMIDTLGMNSRSMSSFLLYQQTNKESDHQHWLEVLQSAQPSDILDEQLLLSEIDKLQEGMAALDTLLQQQQLQSVEETLENCQRLFSKDLVTLRGQCASLRRTIDAHVDTVAIASAPLSAEQATLQQDLRKASTAVQSQMANLEKEISLLRAKLADSSRPDTDGNFHGSSRHKPMPRPTVEAVTKTIATMTNMAEKKSGDIDVLEAQLRKLGIDVSAAGSAHSRSASPFLTPPPKQRLSRAYAATPGSRGSADGAAMKSAYHTPESASKSHVLFRSSLLGSTGKSRSLLQSVSGPGDLLLAAEEEDARRWKAKSRRRSKVVGHLRTALVDGNRKVKVRGMDEI
ncbi:hypothetical protein AJ79_06527 [Helicocarpus griseus UAMH5409]|uniref:Nucleoporin Nup159/Nup146 N-terminal domain-containing protein n=1 Tax=Helicocarpus griseus UAMH5409 TaxID=1447875 RepID=A0A2B7XCQ9_9EURO|nr:hypothetical protein AJ79_06527 [Helicocarpus griseus UAMH5409]